ncbi:ImmA/IrrE family metallo-endopeptidase [Lysinibacillus sp. NPDC086135]|uniref:ImmA/IrrE family metallo-endopeptidase n=1 Tax=Lysinibacillus sp. NPDC086135 TaxID=3364130 RepID=UPI0038046E34
MNLIKKATYAAEKVYKQNQLPNMNPDNYRCDILLLNILCNEDIYLDSRAFKKDLCGMLILDEDEKTLVYNSNQSQTRRNFTIGHELGHYFLHREKKSQFRDRTKDILDNTINEFEMQANAFASQLLLPNFFLYNLIGNGYHFYQIYRQTQISKQALYWRLVNYLIDIHKLEKLLAEKIVKEFQDFSIASMKNLVHHKWSPIYALILNNTHPIRTGIEFARDSRGEIIGIKSMKFVT